MTLENSSIIIKSTVGATYSTPLLFAYQVYFDNISGGKAQGSLFDIINYATTCLTEFVYDFAQRQSLFEHSNRVYLT